MNNIHMNWKVNTGDNTKGIILQNENTMQEICLVSEGSAADAIKNWNPSTVVVKFFVFLFMCKDIYIYIYHIFIFIYT